VCCRYCCSDCSVLQCVALLRCVQKCVRGYVLRCVSVCYNVVQCQQCASLHSGKWKHEISSLFQHTVTHSNTLQHTATHSNTLQDTVHDCIAIYDCKTHEEDIKTSRHDCKTSLQHIIATQDIKTSRHQDMIARPIRKT